MPKDPLFGLSYAPSSYGKTVDAGYAFPNGLFICKRGGIKSITSVCGFTPDTVLHTTLDDATKVLDQQGKKYDTIVVDEFDFLVEDTMRQLEKRFSGFKLFGELRQSVMRFREAARNTPAHVWLTALEKAPKVREDGSKVKGGPALTGDLPEKVPAMCDLVLRGARDPLRRPWPGIYRLDVNSSEWVGKDRDNGTPDPAPMNIGEILRLNGYEVSRLPSAPWQEALVAGISAEILSGVESETDLVVRWYAQLLSKGVPPQMARWTVRDGWDRATLTLAKQVRTASFF